MSDSIDPEIERMKDLLRQRQALREKQRNAERRKLFFKAFSVPALALLIGACVFLLLSKVIFPAPHPSSIRRIVDADTLRAKVEYLEAQLAKIRAEETTKIRSAEGPNGPLLHDDGDVQKLNSRVTAIESSILVTPEKALTLPLLRLEVVEATKRAEENTAQIRAELQEVRSQQQWLLNLLITSLVAAAIGGVRLWVKSLRSSKAG